MNKQQLMEDFKTYLIESYNDDVYYQLKSFLQQCEDLSDDDYSETLDYIVNNLHGNIAWVD